MDAMEEMVEAYRAKVQELVTAEHIRSFHGMPIPAPEVAVTYGPRFARVMLVRENGKRRTAHSFVDLTTGDILKADGWKRPAKHRRGTVRDLGAGGFTEYGAWGLSR